MLKINKKVKNIQKPLIRAIGVEFDNIGGINLGQGVCKLPIEPIIKYAAYNAIMSDKNSYSVAEGILELRNALADKISKFNNFSVDPLNELIITQGATGAFVCAVKTLFEEGDEVILFEPFYPLHRNILEFFDVKIKTVPINLKDFSVDISDIRKAISKRTKGIIICSPGNPFGKVFDIKELMEIGNLAESNNLVIIADEIYEHITYPGHKHVSIASFEQFKPRIVTISGFSKTYSMTGWRLGYASGPSHVIKKMALVQDLLYVCPPTPLQHGLLSAFLLDDIYYKSLRKGFLAKRNFLFNALNSVGINAALPQGSYYMLGDFSGLDIVDDEAAISFFVKNAKVAAVPGSIFFENSQLGRKLVRFCYAVDHAQLVIAAERINKAVIDLNNTLPTLYMFNK
jgi:aminotransferase